MARSIHRRWTADDVTKLRQLAGKHPRNAIAAQLAQVAGGDFEVTPMARCTYTKPKLPILAALLGGDRPWSYFGPRRLLMWRTNPTRFAVPARKN